MIVFRSEEQRETDYGKNTERVSDEEEKYCHLPDTIDV